MVIEIIIGVYTFINSYCILVMWQRLKAAPEPPEYVLIEPGRLDYFDPTDRATVMVALWEGKTPRSRGLYKRLHDFGWEK